MTRNTFMIRRVSERITSAAAAIAMTALLAIASDARADNDAVEEPVSVTVAYSAVEAATDEGAAKLYQKLKIAAHSVCDVYDGKTLNEQIVEKKCYERALQAAVNKVSAFRVTALYEADTRDLG